MSDWEDMVEGKDSEEKINLEIGEEVTLEKMQLHLRHSVPRLLDAYYAIPAKVRTEEAFDEEVLHVLQPVLGETVQQVQVQYPEDWWQAFKEQFFPEWALERWPIKYRQIRLSADAMYPHISIPEEKSYIRLAKTRIW